MIELRWAKTKITQWSDDSYGEPVSVDYVKTLQYRYFCMPKSPPAVDVKFYGGWSEWIDVPVEVEE